VAGAARGCNLNDLTSSSPVTVTQVAITPGSGFAGLPCGQETVTLPPNARGTLTLRYGMDDNTATRGRTTLSVTVLDTTGRLLRKATGVAYLGGGLEPLWVDLAGGHTVIFSFDGTSDGWTAVTGLGIVPAGSLPLYSIANLVVRAPGGRAVISPDVFMRSCNADVGGDDYTVNQRPVFGYTYLLGQGCGSAAMLICCTKAAGTFRALFGVPDSDAAGAQATVTIVVQDKDNHVLRRARIHASYGQPPIQRGLLPVRPGRRCAV
jgi:hypothetical protein